MQAALRGRNDERGAVIRAGGARWPAIRPESPQINHQIQALYPLSSSSRHPFEDRSKQEDMADQRASDHLAMRLSTALSPAFSPELGTDGARNGKYHCDRFVTRSTGAAVEIAAAR